MPVKAVTFDLWDTIVYDDSDEPKRAAAGEPPKSVARRDLVHSFVGGEDAVSREMVDLAYDVADAAFRKVWHEQHVTWTVAERLELVLGGLKQNLPAERFAELVRLHEEMELVFSPDPAEGIHEAIRSLHGKYKLAIVSDAIFSPGRCLRTLLEREGLLEYFDGFVFSDEAGCSKPDGRVFHEAAGQLGCDVTEIVHIGDREHNDVGGPHAVGARAVLLTAVKDRGTKDSKAEAVCDDMSQLPSIIDSLND